MHHGAVNARLVLLHSSRSAAVSGTARWLNGRAVQMHHHTALDDTGDVKRIARFVRGRATGFVAGGGGALGSAHLGVYRAFAEAGWSFDLLGGTSVGAAMVAGLAMGASPDRVDVGTHNIFVRSRAFRRLTLPWFSLLDHTVFDRALQEEYGDVRIEDLWIPFFAVASDVSNGRPAIIREGPLWEAVRASSAIPGVLPPFFTDAGSMLVDGGLMNNVPLDVMQQLKTGPNVVVALSAPRPRYHVPYHAIPGLWGTLRALVNPLARRRLPAIPSAVQVITSSLLAGRTDGLTLGEHDILLRPPAPPGTRFSSWNRHAETYRAGYEYAVEWLASPEVRP